MKSALLASFILIATAVRALAFVPSDVAGLQLWLEADNLDGYRNASLAPDAAICTWTDLSSNGYTVTADPTVEIGTAAISTARNCTGTSCCPTYKTGVLNSSVNKAPGLLFDGTSDAFTLGHQLDCKLLNTATVDGQYGGTPCPTPVADKVKYTAFFVVRAQTKTNVALWTNTDQYAETTACSGTYTGEGSAGNCTGYTCNLHQCMQGRALAVTLYPYGGFPDAVLSIGTADDLTYGSNSPPVNNLTFAADSPGSAQFRNSTRVVSYVFDQSQAVSAMQRLWVDGASQSGTSAHAAGGRSRTRSAPHGTMEIGRWFYDPDGVGTDPDFVFPPFGVGEAANHFQGYYAALLVYTGALGLTDRQSVESYLTGKYITGSEFTPLPATWTPTPAGTATPTPTSTPTVTPTPTTTARNTRTPFSCPYGPASE